MPYAWPLEQRPVPDGPLTLKCVVGGFPRTSTTFLKNCLWDMGVRACHEGIFQPTLELNEDQMDCQYEWSVDVTGFAGPYLQDLRCRGVYVLHLMRHPVDTINSFLNHFDFYFPGDRREYVPWAVKVWYEWQKVWAEFANLTVYFDNPFDTLSTVVGIVGAKVDANKIHSTIRSAKRGRSTPGDYCTWNDLPKEVAEFAYGEHGYLRGGERWKRGLL